MCINYSPDLEPFDLTMFYFELTILCKLQKGKLVTMSSKLNDLNLNYLKGEIIFNIIHLQFTLLSL